MVSKNVKTIRPSESTVKGGATPPNVTKKRGVTPPAPTKKDSGNKTNK
jgi:hypothetical protein